MRAKKYEEMIKADKLQTKLVKKKNLSRLLLDSNEWIQLSKIEAHRFYLYSLSLYKFKRYNNAKALKWYDIDQNFIRVLEMYTKKELEVRVEKGKKLEGFIGQPIFIDIIIKVVLHRVYANVMDRKLLTAEKILDNA